MPLTIPLKGCYDSFVKIELIVPAVEENARVPNLAFPLLAGLSPTDAQISFTDDLLTPIRLDKDLKEVDLVGITVLTKTALRAYDIADAYRRREYPSFSAGFILPPFLRKPRNMLTQSSSERLKKSGLI